jgi:elongation factor G
MRDAIVLVAVSTLLLGEVGATLVPGAVLWDIERRQHEAPRMYRRAKSAEEALTNEKQRGGYYATVRVGTPFQEVVLQLDTGSSDTWVPAARAPICSDLFDVDPCPLGSFDEGGSSTFKMFLPGDFNISYLDGSYSKGDYFTDTIEIGGAEVKSLPMGLGLNTSVNHGLVGLGYTINEVSIRMNGSEYDNLPVAMARDNVTNTVAYSLWLNDLGKFQFKSVRLDLP